MSEQSSCPDLIAFWFSHEDYWFKPSPNQDAEITRRFYHLLNQNLSPSNSKLTGQALALKFLEAILLYDQCIRHFYRDSGDDAYKNAKRFYGKLACLLTEEALILDLDRVLSPAQRCFLLMPYRHTFDLNYLELVLQKIRSYREEETTNSYYRRFYYATVESYAKLKTETVKVITPGMPKKLGGPEGLNLDWDRDILCDTCRVKGDPNIDIMYELVGRDETAWRHEFYRVLRKPKPNNPYTISLSGGVDSMVCSYLLKILGYDVVAMMINYGNRETSDDEARFVRWWCQKLGIPLYLRHITEIKRTRDGDREFYEKVTKEIRFDMYRLIGRPVILGHNFDDCIENIFANLKKSRSLDNLLGMSEYSEQNGVEIVRPVLKFDKKQILALANAKGIPYLYDSTPKWSDRGRMRDQLIPFVKGFDRDILPGLIKASAFYTDLYESFEVLVENSLEIKVSKGETMLSGQDHKDEGMSMSFGAIEDCLGAKGSLTVMYKGLNTFVFWRKVFSDLGKKYGIGGVTNKSIQTLINRIQGEQWGKVSLAKNLEGDLSDSCLEIFEILIEK